MIAGKKIDWLSSLVDLVIVIIGITIAFWLNNLAEESKARDRELIIISDLRDDIVKDSTRLEIYKEINTKKVESLKSAIPVIESDNEREQISELLPVIATVGNISFFTPENFTATSLLQSGDIKFIKNAEVKKELLRLLRIYQRIEVAQAALLQGLDANYFPLMNSKIDLSTFEVVDLEFFYSVSMKNYLIFTINDTSYHIQLYQDALEQIEKLLKLTEDY